MSRGLDDIIPFNQPGLKHRSGQRVAQPERHRIGFAVARPMRQVGSFALLNRGMGVCGTGVSPVILLRGMGVSPMMPF
jgi:hypothetical protein